MFKDFRKIYLTVLLNYIKKTPSKLNICNNTFIIIGNILIYILKKTAVIKNMTV